MKFLRLLIATFSLSVATLSHAADKPTVVLVHGAFAESASWSGVISVLKADGYRVIAAANPLRGVANDAQAVSAVVNSVSGPVVLVGHSYGGNVISNVEAASGKIKGLVFVAALAPDVGESAGQLAGKFPGSTMGAALAEPLSFPDGTKELYLKPELFSEQMAADAVPAQAELMSMTQRPIAMAALGEKSAHALWKALPSRFVYGDADKSIPAEAHRWMAQRANSLHTVVIKGGSHMVMSAHPVQVAKLIEEAANAK